ncbi:MAG TPA: FAD-dependent oxidoreductase [Candidatus Krumholzibacteria bacterium]
MTLDLQAGLSYWLLRNTNLPVFPGLDHDERADVLVVGAGVTGELAAAVLADAGMDVVVLDWRALAQGSSGASTALISYEPDLSISELSALRGRDAAVEAYRAARDANHALARLIERLGIQCGFERAASVHIARSLWQSVALRTEHRLRNQNGFACEYLSARELEQRHGLVARSALWCDDAAQLDPVRLLVGLLDHVARRGSRIHRAHVTTVERAGDGFVALTRQGPCVRARRVVFATGYESQERLRQDSVQLTSTFVIAADARPGVPEWLRCAILWDTDRPYHYVRSADGRLLAGGGDVPFVDEAARDALMPRKADELLRYLRAILPGLRLDIFSTWCGTFARTDDSLPYIGEHPDMPGVFHSLGYGGNGITAGMIGALELLDVVHGRPHEHAALFSFVRDRPRAHRAKSVGSLRGWRGFNSSYRVPPEPESS